MLQLYIAGRTPRSEHAIAHLHRICEGAWPGQYELVVIDVLECPHLATAEQILVTPTLIRTSPPPIRRVVGDLSSTDKVLLGLAWPPYAGADQEG